MAVIIGFRGGYVPERRIAVGSAEFRRFIREVARDMNVPIKVARRYIRRELDLGQPVTASNGEYVRAAF